MATSFGPSSGHVQVDSARYAEYYTSLSPMYTARSTILAE